MDWCRVVGPHGLCRPLDDKQGFPTNNLALAPCQGRAGQGRGQKSVVFREIGQGAGGAGFLESASLPWGYNTHQKTPTVVGLGSQLYNGLTSVLSEA